MFKGIQQKLLASLTLVILLLFGVTATVIFWRLDQSLNKQSAEIGQEAFRQSRQQIGGHHSVFFSFMNILEMSVEKFSSDIAGSSSVVGNIENQQLEALAALLSDKASDSSVDYTIVLDKDGVFQASYPPAEDGSAVTRDLQAMEIYKAITMSDERTAVKGFCRHSASLLGDMGLPGGEGDALHLMSAEFILDEFEDKYGLVISGKILNDYNAIFDQVHKVTGSSGLLIIGNAVASGVGIDGVGDVSSLQVPADAVEKMHSGDAVEVNMPLAGVNYMMRCSPLSTVEGNEGGAICVGQTAKKVMSVKDRLLASGSKAKINIQLWLAGVGAISLLLFILAVSLVTRSINKPLARICTTLATEGGNIDIEAGQIAYTSKTLFSGASQQASAVEATSASMEELYSMTRSNSQSAQELEKLMGKVQDIVTSTSDDILKVNSAIEDISRASDQTYNIIKSIDGIAFQTNLLALNAAVEAARAGESGAGFAIVADEVRNLAQRAASAAKETAQLIEGTVQKVKDGKVLVNTTTESFSEVSGNVVKVSSLINSIATASQRQSDGFEQVNRATSEIEGVTHHNSAAAEETASVSETFLERAQRLNGLVYELELLVYGKLSDASKNEGASKSGLQITSG